MGLDGKYLSIFEDEPIQPKVDLVSNKYFQENAKF